MFASTLTTMASFEVVLLGENNIPFFRIIEVAFFSGYISIDGHNTKM